MRVVLIGRYPVPFPYSEHDLDYRMMRAWASALGALDLIVQGDRIRWRVWRDDLLTVHYAPCFPGGGNALFLALALSRLLSLNRQAGIDVVNGSDLLGGLAGLLARPWTRARVLAQLQGLFLDPAREAYSPVKRVLVRRVSRAVCRRADLVRCLYAAAAEEVIALGVPPQRIAIVPSRCDEGKFDPARFPSGRRSGHRILYVGNLVRAKGVHHLLGSMRRLGSEFPEIHVSIVGSGVAEDSLRRTVRESGLSSRVTFLGRRPHEELPEILSQSDLLVLPSLSEATPRVVMEAMAMEVPVVASAIGGLPEMVRPGVTGLLVPPGDVAELTAAIRWALSDPDWLRVAGRLARFDAVARYSQEQHTRLMVSLHQRLAG